MTRKTLIVLLVLSAAAIHPLFSQQETSREKTIRFGTYPFGDAARIYRAFSPLVAYLSQETGTPFRLVVTRDYQELARRLADGTIDVAWTGSAIYAAARKDVPGLQYLATYLERDVTGDTVQPYYRSVILTLKSTGITDIHQLEGKRFGFTTPSSAAGYAYPQMLLRDRGIDYPTFFGSTFFLGRHIDVIEALLAGSLDAGAVSDGTWYNAKKAHGDKFRVLATTEPIPLDAVVAAAHVGGTLAAHIRDLLVALPENHDVNRAIRRHLGWPAAGFAVEDADFYQSVDRALGGPDAQ